MMHHAIAMITHLTAWNTIDKIAANGFLSPMFHLGCFSGNSAEAGLLFVLFEYNVSRDTAK